MAMSKKALWTLAGSAAIIVPTVAVVSHIKLNNKFKPVIMNYQNYISESSKSGIEKHFDYKEFGDVSEFSKAIEDSRVVGGVGSDFQIVRMAQKELIRKVDFARLFKANESLSKEFSNDENLSAQENLEKRRAAIAKLLRKETLDHLDNYNQFMYILGDKNKGIIDIDNDGIQDQLWEFTIPYYIQDKVIAYTVGDANYGDGNKPLKDSIASWSEEKKETIREKGIKFTKQDLVSIGKTLRENGYKYFEWTEAMRDNLLAGSELVNNPNFTNNGYTGIVDKQNYQEQIQKFLELVEQTSGKPLSDTAVNSVKSSGLELLTALIDIGVKQEVGFIYNGDALDALNGNDNFDYIEDGTSIKIIRPKNNLTLLDGWIITKNIDDELANQLLDDLYENIYKGEDYTLNQLIFESAENVKYNYVQKDDRLVEEKGRAYILNFESLPNLANFDFVNYTPSFKSSYEYFEKFYFNDALTVVKETNSDEEEGYNVLLNKNGEILKDDPLLENILTETTSNYSKLAKNIYKSQQKTQTIYGLEPDENTLKEEIYEINYKFIAPVGESLNSEIKTKYIITTKS
ncbi:hypothetical protein [Mesomycoplasma lagogenitalium]|uniref:Spermidine/putrescine ABC transporter substrate-binding protein n=1 Tax=Mesomycoplasma lagogenitalium TaxID=171286 RepID=A0ABY8LUU0_9BACT|nr:hypothetical protein [Mesomycoplasma lagogenitalium]WGI36997.1 hypothetical protein QEG99_01785 [Mesomycoplasma lagogenitalium]